MTDCADKPWQMLVQEKQQTSKVRINGVLRVVAFKGFAVGLSQNHIRFCMTLLNTTRDST